jgi:hypothetical protein
LRTACESANVDEVCASLTPTLSFIEQRLLVCVGDTQRMHGHGSVKTICARARAHLLAAVHRVKRNHDELGFECLSPTVGGCVLHALYTRLNAASSHPRHMPLKYYVPVDFDVWQAQRYTCVFVCGCMRTTRPTDAIDASSHKQHWMVHGRLLAMGTALIVQI